MIIKNGPKLNKLEFDLLSLYESLDNYMKKYKDNEQEFNKLLAMHKE